MVTLKDGAVLIEDTTLTEEVAELAEEG